jgi:hypothetical protein
MSTEPTSPEPTSSESEVTLPEETTGAYEEPVEYRMESSEFRSEAPVETGRLPESGFEPEIVFGDDVDKKLQEGVVIGGP